MLTSHPAGPESCPAAPIVASAPALPMTYIAEAFTVAPRRLARTHALHWCLGGVGDGDVGGGADDYGDDDVGNDADGGGGD